MTTFDEFTGMADYSLMDNLTADSNARSDGDDHRARQVFSGDLSAAPNPMRKVGWATGYALSIYGAEYIGVLGKSPPNIAYRL